MTAKGLTLFLHSRVFARLALAVSLAATSLALVSGDVLPITGNKGIALPSPNEWLAGRPTESLLAAMLLVCATILLMMLTHRLFNLLRTISELPAAMAALMLMATPSLEGQLYGGTLLCAVMWGVIPIMFSTFGSPGGMQRRVFLVFFALSLAGLCQYAFLLYVPVMLLATVQMRIFNLRTLLAALIGLVTPLWLLLGFGIISPSDLRLPELEPVFKSFDSGNTLLTAIAMGLTAIAALTCISLNLMRFIAYNARSRGFNGMLILMTVWTILLMGLDYTNAVIYQPLLATLSACWLGHYFTNHRQGRSYLAILLTIIAYITLYIWNIVR